MLNVQCSLKGKGDVLINSRSCHFDQREKWAEGQSKGKRDVFGSQHL